VRLGARPLEPGTDLYPAFRAILDRRLARESSRPLAVAFSGGGDSLALLLMTVTWARDAGRKVVALTVDHRLQASSADWTRACEATARGLGVGFRALAWEGVKPAAGLPAAARAARHALLAHAARQIGARVILIGHTEDDRREAGAMRAAGATTPDPRQWAPSPAWPQGRDVFLLRPLLDIGRASLRDWLRARGETWIDDPANEDLRYARSRARQAAASGPPEAAADPPTTLARLCAARPGGVLSIRRAALAATSARDVRRFLALACVCGGGGTRRPSSESLDRAAGQLRGEAAVTLSLAGTRIEAGPAEVLFMREAGETARGGLAPLALTAGEIAVWDGRFEIAADGPVEVRALATLTRRLPRGQRERLRTLPAGARPGLPAIVRSDGVDCPLLAPVAGVDVRDLVADRLAAAAGLIEREPV